MPQSARDVTVNTEYIKVLVVGKPGTGKSVFASTFPTPGYVFDFSNGILIYRGKDFDYDQFPTNVQGWIAYEKAQREIEPLVREGKYQTVIVDDITAMQSLAMERALSLDPKRSATGGPIWNVHYGMARNLMEGKLRQIISWNCNIVFIAHVDVKTNDDGAVIGMEPLMIGQLSTVIPGYFDEVYWTQTKREGDKTTYWMQTVSIGFKDARSRISGQARLLPDFVPNEYPKLMEVIRSRSKKLEEVTLTAPTSTPTLTKTN